MQFQADLLGIPVEVAAVQETTALGRGLPGRAGVGVVVATCPSCAVSWRSLRRYEPRMSADQREALYARWLRAVDERGWATSP